MWFDVGCQTEKNLAVCRVANTAKPTTQAPTLQTMAPTIITTMPTNAPTVPTSLGAFRFSLLEDAVPFIYSAAKVRCESLMNGVLAKIDNQADYDAVASLIEATSYANKQAWIGLNDITTEGTFVYVEDDSVLGSFQPWCAPNPNNLGGNENCVVMNGDDQGCAGGMWYDVNCQTEKNLAVCRVPNDHLAILANGEQFSYAAAKARCGSQMGGVLAKIASQIDYDTTVALMSQYDFPNKQAWFGLNDLAVEGTFRYVEDDSLLGAFQVRQFLVFIRAVMLILNICLSA
jgi:hypothetical protein